MSYPSANRFVVRYQLETSVPSFRRITVGVSAELRNQLPPDATRLTSDHPVGVRSANFSVAALSPCSTQLRSAPRLETVNCGSMLCVPTGSVSGSTLTAHDGGVDVTALAADCLDEDDGEPQDAATMPAVTTVTRARSKIIVGA